MATYTFGADEPAVNRLGMVAEVYNLVSREFLAAHAPTKVDTALDLGCGPGFSTQLLDYVCTPETLIGVDSSTEFLDVARARLPAAQFYPHDVTVLPLPAAPVQLMYARMVLAHLPDPLGVATAWMSQLDDGGVLLIEDLERIEAPAGPLRTYDDIAADVVRAGGGLMYAGPAVASLGGAYAEITVPAAVAAKVYLFNVKRWKADPAAPVRNGDLSRLAAELSELASASHGEPVIWVVRQIALHS